MQLSLLLLSAIAGNAIAAPVLGGSVNEGKIVDSVVDPVVNTANGAVDNVLEKKRGVSGSKKQIGSSQLTMDSSWTAAWLMALLMSARRLTTLSLP